MNMILKITTFTDESGQDTKGKFFVVSTVICNNDVAESLEKRLNKIEKIAKKSKKWYKSSDRRRKIYIDELLKSRILSELSIYYSYYSNKLDYSKLIGSHIAKSVITHTADINYKAKIFIDKTNKKTIDKIKSEIKGYRIKYQKIRGISDESSALVRLADATCGLIRDVEKSSSKLLYKRFLLRIKSI